MTVVNSAASGVKLSGFFQGNFTVSHCNFSKNHQNGIDINLGKSNATVDVMNTTMNDNGAIGMSLRNVTSGTVRFLNNTVNDNLGQGLHLDHINATVVIANSSFVNNPRLSVREGYTLKLSDVHGGHVDIVHNDFVDNLNYHRQYFYDRRNLHHVLYVEYRNATHLKVSLSLFWIIKLFYCTVCFVNVNGTTISGIM